MPVVDHSLKRRVERVRRRGLRLEPADRVKFAVGQVDPALRVGFQAAHLALVAQVADRGRHGGVIQPEIGQRIGVHREQVTAGDGAVVNILAVRRNRDAVAGDAQQRGSRVGAGLRDEGPPLHRRAEARVGQHGRIVRQAAHRLARGEVHDDDAAARRAGRIGDVRKARPAARRIEAHVVERGALGDQAVGEHDGANHGVGGQVDGDEFRAARDQRGAGAGVAHVEAPERVVGVHVDALYGEEMPRGRGGVQPVDLGVGVDRCLAVDDLSDRARDVVDAIAGE